MKPFSVRLFIVAMLIVGAGGVATRHSGAKSAQGDGGIGVAAVETDRYGFVPFTWSIVDTPTNTGAICTFFPETDQVAFSAGNLLRLINTTTEQQSLGVLSYVSIPSLDGGIGTPYYSSQVDVVLPPSGQVDVAPNGLTVPIGGNLFFGYQVFPIGAYGTVRIRIEHHDRKIFGDPTVYPATTDCVSLFPPEVTLAKESGLAGESISYQARRFHCCSPHYIFWDGVQIDRYFIDNEGTRSFTVPPTTPGQHQLKFVDSQGYEILKTFTVLAPPAAKVTISPSRTTVNNWLTYQVVGFPQNAPIAITWRRLSGSIIPIATVQTNGIGAVSGQFRVPATPGGPGQQIIFKSGSVSKTVGFDVAPRIKVNTNPAVRGQYADVSLRGYAKNETVRIRWKKGDSWITLATVVTSNTGSANVNVLVPLWAPNGSNSVRGDGTVFHQQTNAAMVNGGPFSPAEASTPTATPSPTRTVDMATPTPTLVAEPTATPTGPAIDTESPEPAPTLSPTVETPPPIPTETPTAEPTEAFPAAEETAAGSG